MFDQIDMGFVPVAPVRARLALIKRDSLGYVVVNLTTKETVGAVEKDRDDYGHVCWVHAMVGDICTKAVRTFRSPEAAASDLYRELQQLGQ